MTLTLWVTGFFKNFVTSPLRGENPFPCPFITPSLRAGGGLVFFSKWRRGAPEEKTPILQNSA